MTQELIDMALALSPTEKTDLIEMLRLSMIGKRPAEDLALLSQRRGETLLEIAAIALGVGGIGRSGRHTDVFGRSLVAWQMRSEGFSTIEIGDAIGKDHSTITYLSQKVADIVGYPDADREGYTMVRNFMRLVDNADR